MLFAPARESGIDGTFETLPPVQKLSAYQGRSEVIGAWQNDTFTQIGHCAASKSYFSKDLFRPSNRSQGHDFPPKDPQGSGADRGVRDVCLRSGTTVGQPDITHQRRARR